MVAGTVHETAPPSATSFDHAWRRVPAMRAVLDGEEDQHREEEDCGVEDIESGGHGEPFHARLRRATERALERPFRFR